MASSPEINQWNEGWRSSPMYGEYLRQIGVPDPSRPFKLSDKQRKQLQGLLEAEAGQKFPKGVEIDPAGNMNENEGFGKQAKKWGPLVGAIAVTLFGIPGVMPGVLSGGGAAGAAGAAGTGGAAGAGGGAGTAAGVAGAAGGGWSALGNFLKRNIVPIAGAAGGALAAGAQASATNRGAELDATMEAERLNQQAYRDWFNQMVQREETGTKTRNDAWKAMQQGAYTRDWAPSGQQFSPYTRALTAPSEDVREAGGARAEDARTRLTGYTMPEPERQKYTIDPRLVRGGGWERLAGMVGAGLTGVGAIANLRNPRTAAGAPAGPTPTLVNTGVIRPSVMPRTFIDPNNPLGYADDDWSANIHF